MVKPIDRILYQELRKATREELRDVKLRLQEICGDILEAGYSPESAAYSRFCDALVHVDAAHKVMCE